MSIFGPRDSRWPENASIFGPKEVQEGVEVNATALLRDGTQPATGNLDMGTNLIQNVGNPVDPQDAATKNYVDARENENSCLFTVASRGRIEAGDYAWCPHAIRDQGVRAVGIPIPVDFEVTHMAVSASARGGVPVADEVRIALTKADGSSDSPSPHIRTPSAVRILVGKLTGFVKFPTGVLYRAGDRINLRAITTHNDMSLSIVTIYGRMV